ncbi:MAG: peroxiredoxin [Rickettsiaceae bacterium]|nr:peroxiredoxin [Rickettsiaceae bacterium]
MGDLAPNFSIKVSKDSALSLENLRGKYIILYFYPKDSTPGCTIEARSFNSLKEDFSALGAEIIGVSKDPLTSHDKFRKNHSLQFHLGSDTSGDLCEKFGVWVEKSIFGMKYSRIERSTFLINPEGKFAYIWQSVSIWGHAKDVLKKLTEIKGIDTVSTVKQ